MSSLLMPIASAAMDLRGAVELDPLTALVLLAMAIALPCVAAYAIDLRSRCLDAAGCIAEQAAEAQESVARARIAEDALRRVLLAADTTPQGVERQPTD